MNKLNKYVIGIRISVMLGIRNMTQRDLSKMINATEVSISRYISGDRVPKATLIYEMAIALDVSSDYLLGLTNSRKGLET